MRGSPIRYSDRELAWIKVHSDRPRKELHRGFQEAFDRPEVGVDHIKALCSRKGWSAGPEGRKRNKGTSSVFTNDQMEWIRSHSQLSRADVHAAFMKAFPTSMITAAQIISYRKRAGLKTGRNGHFVKGTPSWNTGKKIGSHPNSRATQFRKGQEPSNLAPLGAERTTEDGYIEIKVAIANRFHGSDLS